MRPRGDLSDREGEHFMIKTVIAASALATADRGITDFFRNGGPAGLPAPKAPTGDARRF